jgi:hypothetical protein
VNRGRVKRTHKRGRDGDVDSDGDGDGESDGGGAIDGDVKVTAKRTWKVMVVVLRVCAEED